MTVFKKFNAYSDAKCEWTSSTYPHAEEVAQLKAENARLREVVSDGEENARLILGESRALRAENAKLRELLQTSLRDFRRIYDYDEQDGWRMVDAIDRMVTGMRKLGLDAGRTEQELRNKVD